VSGIAGKPVVITGGDGALGQAVVAAFAAAGAVCHLPLFGKEAAGRPDGRTAGSSLPSGRPVILPSWNIDLTDEDAVAAYYAAIPSLFASIHLAGGYAAKPVADTTRHDLERMLQLNLSTAFFCCREAVKRMRRSDRGGGRIVNVGARVSEQPAGGAVAYSIAKGGVASLTRALAVELKGEGILVNAVLPSIIDTPANRAAMPRADFASWPRPEDLARTILWLASPENTVTSGALVPVYGKA
jgi:NAD(P)-dependent dehydrogenase (short-subunit alcohol dehydrogenase family)